MASALIIPSEASFAEMQVAGLPVLERLICGLGRVANCVYVVRGANLPPTIEADLAAAMDRRAIRPRIEWVGDPGEVSGADGVFVVARPAVIDQRLATEMAASPGAEEKILRCRRSNQSEAPLFFVGRQRWAALCEMLRGGARAQEVLTQQATADFDPGHKVCEVVTDEASRRHAERTVYLAARKESDTWIAKNFDRHVSLRITRLFMRLGLTPNQVTLVSFSLGMIGSALLCVGLYLPQVVGSGLLVLSIIVDGCDGEVARLTFRESEFGRKLDFFLDNVVNACALFAMGFGYYVQGESRFYLYASLINAGAALASVLPVYFLFFREGKTAIDPDRTTSVDAFSVTENIAGRDYIYMIFVLALAGQLWLFVYLTLGGIFVFLAVTLILLGIKRARQRT